MIFHGSDFGNVVVTGGAGAIGSRLVQRLLRENVERVIVIDDFSSGFPWLLPEDPRLEVRAMDVCDIADLDLPFDEPVIFHLAALFANQNSVDHPLEDLRVNGTGTLHTLLWAARCRARRLVYASAGCTIAGHDVPGPIHERMPVSLFHTTPYQVTKLLGELYCNYMEPGVSTVRCRFFNTFGPGEVPGRYRNVIPNFMWRAMHGEPLIITGSGAETRDFVYVEDLVEGLLLAALTPAAVGQALNIGTGKATSILDLAKKINNLFGNRSEIQFAERRSWDQASHRQADISESRKMLGFEPRTDLATGLQHTADWFVHNRVRIAEEVANGANQ